MSLNLPEQNEQIRLAQIGQLLRELKQEFAAAKQLRMRGKYKPSTREKTNTAVFWQKAAEQAYANGLTANQYITACFAGCKMAEGPFVNSLGGVAAAEWLDRWKKQRTITSATAGGGEIFKPRQAVVGDQARETDLQVRADELTALMNTAHYSILVCRKAVQGSPEFIEAVIDEHVVMDVICRMALSNGHPAIKEKFKDEILDRLHSDPLLIPTLKKLNYPIDEVYAWLVN